MAKQAPWTPPSGLENRSLAALGGAARSPLEAVVNLLAFAQPAPPSDHPTCKTIAARMQAAYALFGAARDEHVRLFGTLLPQPAYGASAPPSGGARVPISPLEFDNDALALSHVQQSAIGSERAAAQYAENGGAPDALIWRDVTVDLHSLSQWLKGKTGAGGRRSGRPPAYDWNSIEVQAKRLMDHHGDFSPDDGEWKAQACLEDALKSFCQTRFQREPASSTLRRRLKPWLDDWREKKRRTAEN
jgi:hypothetical protein